ncbi:hypothetical protein JL720_16430 [Aureococcus anophagefferens]|nr:hypothetical protein JL720_16430 [Aureococcus anophagefferens]
MRAWWPLLWACAAAEAWRYTHVLGANVTRAHILERGCEADGALLRCDPVFIFAGRGHTGSANLAAYLQSHPQLDYGATKEHRFFSRSRRPATPRPTGASAGRRKPGGVGPRRAGATTTSSDTYVATFGRDRVLVLESETPEPPRRRFMEIQAFLGVDAVPTPLPVMNVCKADRYVGHFEGCYNGVRSPERARSGGPSSACNADLEAFLGIPPGTLFDGKPKAVT